MSVMKRTQSQWKGRQRQTEALREATDRFGGSSWQARKAKQALRKVHKQRRGRTR